MATTYSLTGSLRDLLGGLSLERVRAWVEASESMVTDKTSNVNPKPTYLGRKALTVDPATGNFTCTGLPATQDSSWMPQVAAHRIVVEYRDDSPGSKVQSESTNWFPLIADRQLADVIAADPNFIVAFEVTNFKALVAQAQASSSSAATSAAAAQLARQQTEALVVSDLGTTDGQSRALVQAKTSQTFGALADDFTRKGRLDVRDFATDKVTITAAALTAAVEAADGRQVYVHDADLGSAGWSYNGTKAVNLVAFPGQSPTLKGSGTQVVLINGAAGTPVNMVGVNTQGGGTSDTAAGTQRTGVRVENRTGPVTVDNARVDGTANGYAIRVSGGSSVNVNRNVVTNYFDTATTKGSTAAIHLTGVITKARVNNNEITGPATNPGSIGIFLVSHATFNFVVTDAKIDDNTVTGLARCGIAATHEEVGNGFVSGRYIITKNIVRDCREQGIKIKLNKRITIDDNIIENCNTVPELAGELDGGINVQSSGVLHVTNNKIINDGTDGIRVDVKHPEAADPEEGIVGRALNVVSDNIIYGALGSGILLGTGLSDTNVVDNQIANTGGAGIGVNPGSNPTSAQRLRRINIGINQIRNAGTAGISTTNADDVTVLGNTVTMSGGYGIVCDQGAWFNIASNTVHDAGQSGSNTVGIRIGTCTGVQVHGNISGNKQTTSQTYGLSLGSVATVGTNDFTANATAPIQNAANARVQFLGAAPFAKPSPYVQTYTPVSRTHDTIKSAAVATTAATSTTPFGYTTQAQADAIVAAINLLRTDVANVKQVLNSVIDDFQAAGLL